MDINLELVKFIFHFIKKNSLLETLNMFKCIMWLSSFLPPTFHCFKHVHAFIMRGIKHETVQVSCNVKNATLFAIKKKFLWQFHFLFCCCVKENSKLCLQLACIYTNPDITCIYKSRESIKKGLNLKFYQNIKLNSIMKAFYIHSLFVMVRVEV